MYRNIGRKIKGLALVLFWIELVGGVIASLVFGVLFFVRARYDDVYILAGFGVIIFGSAISFLVSWIGAFFMYGFGQLIDDTEVNRQTNQQILRRLEGGSAPVAQNPEDFRYRPVSPEPPTAPVRPAAPAGGWFCKMCGMKNDAEAKFCLRCGTPNDSM